MTARRLSLACGASAVFLLSAGTGPVLAAAEIFIDPVSGIELHYGAPPTPSLAGDYLAALHAGAQHDLRTASDFLAGVQAAHPEIDEILRLTFVSAAAGGELDLAIALAPAILELDPNNAAAHLLLAADHIERQEWAEARADFLTLSQSGITGATRTMLLAWAKLPAEGLAAANAELEPLAQLTSLAVLYHLHRALMADVDGQFIVAGEEYDAALASSEQHSVRLLLLVANFRARNGDLEGAKALLEDFLTESPGAAIVADTLAALEGGEVPWPMVGSATEGLAEVFFQVASILAQEAAGEGTLIQAHLAQRLKPDFDAAVMLLGELAQKREQRAESIAAFESVAPDSPYYSTAVLGLSEELYRTDRVEEAIARLRDLTAARPEDFQPPFRLGNIFRAEQRFEEAVAAYEEAVERLGALVDRYWTVLYYRGIAYERTGAWAQAEADLQHALELQPEQPQVMNYLAYSWIERRENLDEAKAMLVRAVELAPRDGYIVDSLGWALYRMGEYEAAVAELERAIELEPAEAVVNDHLGDAYWRVGRKREARVQWHRALSLEPSQDLDPETVRLKIEEGLPDVVAQ